MTLRAPLLLALLLPLAACAKPLANLPSLAIRDAERVQGQLPPVAPQYVAPPLSDATIATIDSLVSDANSANARFTELNPQTRNAIRAAANAAAGTDAWARAQVALANLEAERSNAAVALADLDRIYIQSAQDNAALARIEAARQQVAAQVDQQSAIISQLAAELAR